MTQARGIIPGYGCQAEAVVSPGKPLVIVVRIGLAQNDPRRHGELLEHATTEARNVARAIYVGLGRRLRFVYQSDPRVFVVEFAAHQ